MKTKEHGTREKLTVLIPYRKGFVPHLSALQDLRKYLAYTFGGYTESEFYGVWMGRDPQFDSLLTETGSRFEVSCYQNTNEIGRRAAVEVFKTCARACGNTWLHIERSAFEAEHVKVN